LQLSAADVIILGSGLFRLQDAWADPVPLLAPALLQAPAAHQQWRHCCRCGAAQPDSRPTGISGLGQSLASGSNGCL